MQLPVPHVDATLRHWQWQSGLHHLHHPHLALSRHQPETLPGLAHGQHSAASHKSISDVSGPYIYQHPEPISQKLRPDVTAHRTHCTRGTLHCTALLMRTEPRTLKTLKPYLSLVRARIVQRQLPRGSRTIYRVDHLERIAAPRARIIPTDFIHRRRHVFEDESWISRARNPPSEDTDVQELPAGEMLIWKQVSLCPWRAPAAAAGGAVGGWGGDSLVGADGGTGHCRHRLP